MNRIIFFGINRSSFVDRLSNNIDDSSKSFWAHWNHDGISGVPDWLPSDQSVGLIQSDCAHTWISQMLGHFQNQSVVHSFHLKLFLFILIYFNLFYLQGVQDGRQTVFELDVHHGTDHLRDFTNFHFGGFHLRRKAVNLVITQPAL